MQLPQPAESPVKEKTKENLTTKTVRGIKWNSVATITNAVVQLGYGAIMARLLDPAAFGLMAMSHVIIAFGSFFSQMGMSQALIHKVDLSQEDIRVGFTSSFVLGVTVFTLAWIGAPLSLYIFDNPQLVPILRVTCFALLIAGLNSTSTSLLRRRMEFKSIAIIQIISYVVGYVMVGITLGIKGFGVWSLVYASICQSLIVTVVSYFFARHSLLLLFDWKYYKPLFAFGSKMSILNFIDFLGAELDTLLIGRFLGQSSLGLYNRAFLLIRQPVSLVVGTISRVLFPAFSRIQTEIEKLKKVYLFSISGVVLIVFPISTAISFASEEIVLFMLGDKWGAAVPILQVLAFTTPFRVLMHFSGIICDATGTLNYKIILNTLYFFVLAIFFFFLRPFGLIGFTYAVLLAAVFKNLGYFLITQKVLNLKLAELMKAYKSGIIAAIITGIFVYLTGLSLDVFKIPNLIILISELIAGAIGFLLALYLIPDKTLLLDIIQKIGFPKKESNSPINQFLSRFIKVLTT